MQGSCEYPMAFLAWQRGPTADMYVLCSSSRLATLRHSFLTVERHALLRDVLYSSKSACSSLRHQLRPLFITKKDMSVTFYLKSCHLRAITMPTAHGGCHTFCTCPRRTTWPGRRSGEGYEPARTQGLVRATGEHSRACAFWSLKFCSLGVDVDRVQVQVVTQQH